MTKEEALTAIIAMQNVRSKAKVLLDNLLVRYKQGAELLVLSYPEKASIVDECFVRVYQNINIYIDKLVSSVAAVLNDVYTREELIALAEFHSTAVGSSVINKMMISEQLSTHKVEEVARAFDEFVMAVLCNNQNNTNN